MKELTQKEAELSYERGETIMIADAESLKFSTDCAVGINRKNSENKSFRDMLTEWYMFNHWGTTKPRPVFLQTERETATT